MSRSRDESGKFAPEEGSLDPKPYVIKLRPGTKQWLKGKSADTVRQLIDSIQQLEDAGLDVQDILGRIPKMGENQAA